MRSIDTLMRSIPGSSEFSPVLHPVLDPGRRSNAFDMNETLNPQIGV